MKTLISFVMSLTLSVCTPWVQAEQPLLVSQQPEIDAEQSLVTATRPTLFKLKDDVSNKSDSSLSGNAGTVLAGLMVVLALIAALAWASKRLNLNLPGSSADLKLISAMSVGPKEKLMLIEVEGEKLLIGVTSQHINTLKQFENTQTDSNPSEIKERLSVNNGEFSQKMQAMLKRGANHDA